MTHPEDQRDLLVSPPQPSRAGGILVYVIVAIVSFVAGWAVSP